MSKIPNLPITNTEWHDEQGNTHTHVICTAQISMYQYEGGQIKKIRKLYVLICLK